MNPSSKNLEADLLKQMLATDLVIASRMLQIGDLTMCQDALSGAASKLNQLKTLECGPSTPMECGGSATPLSHHSLDV